ncbi:MAG: hypothetical protein A3D46_00840 [Candidatus Nealsonbacteria bacterium RIFCSPHIGHO2_02_FULL_43_13]|uniref:Addiction module toxin RelE n=1 Tax=Candidatus Nealsonbacteria bacterium RIFCSPHIGHO2_02_FULL_43_13 TaxID=1801668 RepID=A0A1G2E697_9BACT|nr:MAG: hypothetical protein A3D46_00840 [Candidatus Nealsonbacteria bacterium RIFCSPHIGHO2_02_FULL_43_13]
MYQIRTTPTFDKDIRKLDRQVAKRIIKKIEWLASQSTIPNLPVKYLSKDLEGLQKYRAGDWRVLFWADSKKKEVILYGAEHRKSIYKRF